MKGGLVLLVRARDEPAGGEPGDALVLAAENSLPRVGEPRVRTDQHPGPVEPNPAQDRARRPVRGRDRDPPEVALEGGTIFTRSGGGVLDERGSHAAGMYARHPDRV